MHREKLLSSLDRVESLAQTSKLGRLINNPLKYFKAISRKYKYKRDRLSIEVVTDVFFGSKMHLLLPSSTDIYLTGGKSHSSEIKLARFIIKSLQEGDSFMDVGAHYGYFSSLASHLVGGKGKVISFEAAPNTYKILSKNLNRLANVISHNKAVSDKPGQLVFYQFPDYYSEYNTTDLSQFRTEEWFKKYKPQELQIPATTIDTVNEISDISPSIIKIDVEGAEDQVIRGATGLLKNLSPIVVMEFLDKTRGNTAHEQAASLLTELSYRSFIIDATGELRSCADINQYLTDAYLDSDNIVFVKQES